jgi:oligopeptide transport system substrate-binding protein
MLAPEPVGAMTHNLWRGAMFLALGLAACTNDPYERESSDKKVRYGSFSEAPKTLDPAIDATTTGHAITGKVYDTLLEYAYLKRPYTLIPGLARAVPAPEPRADGSVAYRFEIRDDLLFQQDPCFSRGEKGKTTRQITARDFEFELFRVADPAINSPAAEPFSHIVGFSDFAKKLLHRRGSDAGFSKLPARRQYEEVGGIEGIVVSASLELRIVLSSPYPEILYWFAMPAATPMPWEAVEHYDGREGRPYLADHPVGSGPYMVNRYDKESRIVLDKSPTWYGVRHPEWKAPGGTYPAEGEPGDREAGLLAEDAVGKAIPFVDRIEYCREKERIPAFNKFLQGYFDVSAIVKESFDKVVQGGALSPDMAALGMRVEKSTVPSIYYIGFNMRDPVVGDAGGDRSRKLRQAMSLTVDADEYTRVLLNGRGTPAQSLLPPGIFGYEKGYRNPYRTVDIDGAKRLLREAGYADGIDPETHKPLALTFDADATSASSMLHYQFFVNGWRKIGLDVRIDATSYNQFQQKMRTSAYQIFMWGWVADYPDPENFLFLLWSELARLKGGQNTANFADARYDELFHSMKARPDDGERLAMIREMVGIVERERPWIEVHHYQDYQLLHGWVKNVKPPGLWIATEKYHDVDPELRARRRVEWNEPVIWPVYLLLGLFVAVVVPGIATFFRERQ